MSNKLTIGAAFLLVWYGVARWIILGMTNDISEAWLANPFGNYIAAISIVYLSFYLFCAYKKYIPWSSKLFEQTTYLLTAANSYFLLTMFFDFMHEKNMANFGYLMLDVYILLFYGAMLRLCYLTNANKNITPSVEVSCV